MFEEKGRLILSMWYFPRFVLYFVFSVLFPIILCFSCVVFQAHSTLLTPPLYFISPETSSHQLTYSTSQQDTHLSSSHTPSMPDGDDLPPAGTAGRRVTYLEGEQKTLKEQIDALEGFRASAPGYDVSKLNQLRLWGFTDSDRDTPDGKQKIADKIAELEKEKEV